MATIAIQPLGAHDRPAPVTRIVGIAGSLRHDSFNRKLLRAAAALAPSDVQIIEWDGLINIPPFNEDHEGAPPAAVTHMRAVLAQADAVLIATPEYNGSVPGQLQTLLDWASRPHAASVLVGKPVAVIGASPSPGGSARAQTRARAVLGEVGAQVIERGLTVPHAFRQFDDEGALVDRDLNARLSDLLRDLVERVVAGRERSAA